MQSPVVFARYRLELPQGWRIEPFFFNHERIDPVVEGKEEAGKEWKGEPCQDTFQAPTRLRVARNYYLLSLIALGTERLRKVFIGKGSAYDSAP